MKRKEPMTVFLAWYKGLQPYSHTGGFPALGTIGAALVVLERLKAEFDLDISSHRTLGGGQVKGVSGKSVANVLRAFGETRRFPTEGGRTSRGTLGNFHSLLSSLRQSDLASRIPQERSRLISNLQGFWLREFGSIIIANGSR